MKYKVTSQPIEKIEAEALVVICEEEAPLATTPNRALARHWETFHRAVGKGRSQREWFCTLDGEAECATAHLLLESTAFGVPAPHDEPLKMAAARAVAHCRQHSLHRIAFIVHHGLASLKAAAILEGAVLGDFQDDRFKSNPPARPPLRLQFVVPEEEKKATRRELDRGATIVQTQNHVRRLVNAPHHVLTPAELAGEARRMAAEVGLDCEILDERELRAQGHLPTVEVGRGSEYPPQMVVLRHRPKKLRHPVHVGLAGKGITFDTGGLSIKGRDSMFKMNRDMAGAGTVLGVMEATARLAFPFNVTAVITCAHNAVDGAAYHPGAILTARNGRTIFVENTDAEGRLILTDALHRLGEEGVGMIWDFATLTGACVAALGPAIAGLFTDDDELRALLIKASGNTGEDIWPLPLVREYVPWLSHSLADLNNMSRVKHGGAIHAANFLSHFVPPGVRWAHLDIAGPTLADNPWRYYTPGATGFGVRLAVEALRLMTSEDL